MLNATHFEKLRTACNITGISIASYLIGENTMMRGDIDTNDGILAALAMGALLISNSITQDIDKIKDS